MKTREMPLRSFDEWLDAVKDDRPPTEDDVIILADGRRIDSRDAVYDWLAEMRVEANLLTPRCGWGVAHPNVPFGVPGSSIPLGAFPENPELLRPFRK